MDAATFFDSEWSGVATRLHRGLARHGVPYSDRDDVVQETAVRLLRAWDRVDPARGVDAYAKQIALNVWRDSLRRPQAAESVGNVPDVPDGGDTVERASIARLELHRVAQAMKSLRPSERHALHDIVIAEVNGSETLVPAAQRMARMRARRQLVAALQVASAWVAAAVGTLRLLARGRGRNAVLVGTVATAVAVALGVGTPTEPRLDPAATPRVSAATRLPAGAAPTRVDAGRSGGRVAPAAPPQRRVAVKKVAAADKPVPARVKVPGVATAELAVEADVMDVHVEVSEQRHAVPACVSSKPTDGLLAAAKCEDRPRR